MENTKDEAVDLVLELTGALEAVLQTGINGGDNMRLVHIGMSGKGLTPSANKMADASEAATNKAYAALAKAATFTAAIAQTTPAIGGEAESLAQETPKRPRTFQEKYGRPASAGCTTVGGETEAQIFPPVDGVPEYEPDWPGVIDWFNVLAVNKDGEVWAHVSDPEILGDGFGSDEAYHFDTIPPPPGDTWKQMLYKRPE